MNEVIDADLGNCPHHGLTLGKLISIVLDSDNNSMALRNDMRPGEWTDIILRGEELARKNLELIADNYQ
jgi:hypothetical protein